MAGLSATGILIRQRIEAHGLQQPLPFKYNVFFYLYHRNEGPFLALLGLFSLIVFAVGLWGRPRVELEARRPFRFERVLCISLAGIVFLLGVWGSLAVLHGVALSMDEFAMHFQARIFSQGKLEAALDPKWWRFAYALRPVWIQYDAINHTWASTYLPVYACIRALFLLCRTESWTNPVLAALTVLAIAAVARRLWPCRPQNVALAALFLVSSSQFLLTSMTAYSMPAHLLLNILWLLLYLDSRSIARGLLPWVGVLAMGLHHPFPHALFAAPFLLRWARGGRFRWLAYVGSVYSAGTLVWWIWLRHSQPLTHDGGFLSLFARPELFPQMMHAAIIFSWQSPLVAILLMASFLAWRGLPHVGRDLVAGLALTFLFYCWFPAGQGHGWGYRYIYGVLGNVVLLAVFGAEATAEAFRPWVRGLLAASLALTAAVQLPVRCWQAERFVSPYARAFAYVESLKERVVVVDPAVGWYAQDLVRNDPFLRNDPKLLSAAFMTDNTRKALLARFPGSVHDLKSEELARLGFPGTISSREAASAPAGRR